MYLEDYIYGELVKIRSVLESDYRFILDLRTNDKISKYLNYTEYDFDKQKEWIKNHRDRNDDYYFIIIDKSNDMPIGLASIYNIKNKEAEFGRWIFIGNNKLHNLESVILLHNFAFYNLELDKLYYIIRTENIKSIGFWKRFGTLYETSYEENGFKLVKYILSKELYLEKVKIENEKLLDRFLNYDRK